MQPSTDGTGSNALPERVTQGSVAARDIVHQIDDFDLAAFTAVAAEYGQDRYGYVVTPNVDHFIRYHEDPAFRHNYSTAQYVLLDSRFAARLLLLLKGMRLRVCTGSDLTLTLLSRIVAPMDRIVLIGGSSAQAEKIASLYGLKNVRHHNPPMGFIRNPEAVEKCLEFIEAQSPFRFCFLAVGAPQQEAIAQRLQERGIAKGLALCVGASLNFITGEEKRAPKWMQHMALEWVYRMMQDPGRLLHRYLVRGPRVFAQLSRARVVLRSGAAQTA